MISNILMIGNKVDIRFLQHIKEAEQLGSKARVFQSELYDISEDEIKVVMPIEKGKIILLPVGMRYEFCFYTKVGLYRCEAEILKRYKENNIYIVSAAIKSQFTKYQRREFYRCSCILDIMYQNMNEDIVGMDSKSILENMNACFSSCQMSKGIAVDISGGGLRFVSEKQLKKESYACFTFQLQLSDKINNFKVVGKIITSDRIETDQERKYENRVHFIYVSKSDQEAIIRYIFETERKMVNRKRD